MLIRQLTVNIMGMTSDDNTITVNVIGMTGVNKTTYC